MTDGVNLAQRRAKMQIRKRMVRTDGRTEYVGLNRVATRAALCPDSVNANVAFAVGFVSDGRHPIRTDVGDHRRPA